MYMKKVKPLLKISYQGSVEKNSIDLSIIRPSIVYGDSQTGRSLKFNALYFPIRSAQSIRDIYLNDIANNGGIKAAKNGIYIDKDGYLFLPLKIYLARRRRFEYYPCRLFCKCYN